MGHSGAATPERTRSNNLAEDPPPWLCPAYCFGNSVKKVVNFFEEKVHPGDLA